MTIFGVLESCLFFVENEGDALKTEDKLETNYVCYCSL